MNSSSKFLLDHGLTLLTGTLLGATLTAGMTYENSTIFWQTVGSASAGFGAIGLLIFGYITANSWKHQLATKDLREVAFKWYLQSKQFHNQACSNLRDQVSKCRLAQARTNNAAMRFRAPTEKTQDEYKELKDAYDAAKEYSSKEWINFFQACSVYSEERKSLSSIEGILLASNISAVTKERIIACNDLLIDEHGKRVSETEVYNRDRNLLKNSCERLHTMLEETISVLTKIN